MNKSELEALNIAMDNANEKIKQAFNPCESFLDMAAFVAVMEMTADKIKDEMPKLAVIVDGPKIMFGMGGSLRTEHVYMDEGKDENG